MEHTDDNTPTESERPDGSPEPERPQRTPEPERPAGASGPQSPAGTPGPERAEEAPRRLTRSSGDRMIAGVCGGIARYLKVDATVVRIVAVVLTLLGGAGVVLYVAALLLMPSDSQPAGAEDGKGPLTIAGVSVLVLIGCVLLLGGGFMAAGALAPFAMLVLAGLLIWWLVSGERPGGSAGDVARRAALGIGVLLLCCVVAVGGGLAAGLGGGTVVAALVIASGVMLIAGAFFGGVRWLIPPALSLAVAVGFVSAAGIDLEGGVGERTYRPATANELQDSYRLGLGELVVDLRDTDLPAGDTAVNVEMGMGEARLIVPENVCVASAADIGIGVVELFGRENDGVDLDWDDRPRADIGKSRVVVNAELGVGALVVTHEGSRDSHRGPRFGRFGDSDDETGNAGCRERRAE